MDGGGTAIDELVRDRAPAPSKTAIAPLPLIAHVVDRLAVGGMENGLVNLLNRGPRERWRHAVLCLRDATDFRDRIMRDDVAILELHKRDGKDLAIYARMWSLLRRLRPAIVHTRNLPTIDMALPALLAGAPVRIHGEHGRSMLEPDGGNAKYNVMRRLVSPAVDRYVTVSRDLETWVVDRVGIPRRKVRQIYNGVDCDRFRPPRGPRDALPISDFAGPDDIVIGTVGRMDPIKDQLNLARAFVALHARMGLAGHRLRLVMIGDGALMDPVRATLAVAGLADRVWLPGKRDDVPEFLRAIDIFVLPSLNEGISNTILEAMACGRPVVATDVGGNPELVVDGATGALVPPGDSEALAAALTTYAKTPERIRAHGHAARARAETTFGLDAMVAQYFALYDETLAAKAGVAAAGG